MDYYFQQDTTVVQPIKNIGENTASNNSTDTIVKPQPPTFAQIRYWRWQREKKLLIGNSRYIKPKNKVELNTSVSEQLGIGLPIRKREFVNSDWLTVLLFTLLILFATVKILYGKYLVHLFTSVFNYSTASRMYHEKNYNFLHGSFRLEVFFYFILSAFIYQLVNHFQIKFNHTDFILYLICLGATIAYFLIKKLIYLTLGSTFETTMETREYLFNADNFNKITGLFLFPIVSLIAFNPFKSTDFTVFLGIILFSVFYILTLQRGILILLKKQFSIFYLFLYLCSLEFLPLLLIYKVAVV